MNSAQAVWPACISPLAGVCQTIAADASTSERNRRSLRRSAASRSRRSEMSVLVPSQRRMRPSASRIGFARDRNQRNAPSAPRRGKVSSQASPVAMLARYFAVTASAWSGWWTWRQPQPCISPIVVPV